MSKKRKEAELTETKRQKKHLVRKVLIVLVVLVLIGAIFGGGSKKRTESTTSEEPAATQNVVEETVSKEPEKAGQAKPEATDQAAVEDNDKSETANEPAGNSDGPDVILVKPENIKTLEYGELLSVENAGYGDVVIKAKIEKSFNNQKTIDQNYYSVCDFIRKADLDGINDVQYWAVADMTDGSEAKVISFTVPRNVIDMIVSGKMTDNSLGAYVDDLWILPSLQK